MASGIDVKDLEGKKDKGEGETLIPRDFFWDSVALFVISAIVGLTVLDVVTEFVRGSNVECYLPDGIGNVSQEYINAFCSGNLPFTQYFPVYIIITGILILVPHYLWLNHYRGNFEFFFSQVSQLNRLTDAETVGIHSQQNIQAVKQLTTAFATYKQSTIFLFYVLKLCLQWLFTVGSIVAAILPFQNSNFMEGFHCPQGDQTDEFWPFTNKAFCIYNTLVLISYLRVAYLCLVCVLLVCLTWAILWCFFTHATELGHKDVAEFSYLTGLPTKYYVARLPIPRWRCCKYLRSCLLKFVTTIPWFTIGGGPRIRSDLDFLVMQLFRTDSGLGYTFKDIQTSLALKDLLDDDQRRLHIHYLKHTNKSEFDGMTNALILVHRPVTHAGEGPGTHRLCIIPPNSQNHGIVEHTVNYLLAFTPYMPNTRCFVVHVEDKTRLGFQALVILFCQKAIKTIYEYTDSFSLVQQLEIRCSECTTCTPTKLIHLLF